MKKFNLFILLVLLLLFGCTEKFDNPLDPTDNSVPSLSISANIIAEDSLLFKKIDERNFISGNIDTLNIQLGVSDKKDVDVTISLEVFDRNIKSFISEIDYSFEVSKDSLLSFYNFVPKKSGDYVISITAEDSYEHAITDSICYQVTTLEFEEKDAFMSGILSPDKDTLAVTIVFNSIDSYNYKDDSSNIPDTLQYKIGDEDWKDINNSQVEILEDNKLKITIVDIQERSFEDKEVFFRYALIDIFERDVICSNDGIPVIILSDEEDTEVKIISDSEAFNQQHPILLQFNKNLNNKGHKIFYKQSATTDDFTEITDPSLLSNNVIQINSFINFMENVEYAFEVEYNENTIKNFDLLYDTLAPEIIDASLTKLYSTTKEFNFSEKISKILIKDNDGETLIDSIFSIPVESFSINLNLIQGIEKSFNVTITDIVDNLREYNFLYTFYGEFSITNPPSDEFSNNDTISYILSLNKDLDTENSKVFINEISVNESYPDDQTISFEYTCLEEIDYLIELDLFAVDGSSLQHSWTYSYSQNALSLEEIVPNNNSSSNEKIIPVELKFSNIITEFTIIQIPNHEISITDSIVTFDLDIETYPQIQINYSDIYGNTKTSFLNYSYDITNPQIEMSIPENGSFLTSTILECNLEFTEVLSEVIVDFPQTFPAGTYELADSILVISYTFPEEGNYEFSITMTDLAGNTSSESIQYEFVKVPQIINCEPENLSFLNNPLLECSIVYDTIIDSVDVIWPSEIQGDVSVSNNIVNILCDFPEDGEYTFNITAWRVGGINAQNEISYTLDRAIPELTLITPENESILHETAFQIQLEFNEEIATATSNIGTIGIANKIVTIDYTFTDEQEYVFNYEVTDNAGNTTSGSLTYYYCLPVTIESFVPADNSILNDDLSCIVSCTNPVDHAEITYAGNTVNNTIYGSTVLFDYNFTNQGEYSFVVKVYDMFDVMDEQTVTYTYDSEAPILTSVTPPNESILHAVDFQAELEFNEEIVTATSDIGIMEINDNLVTLDYTFANEQEYVFNYEVTDNAGNIYSDSLTYYYCLPVTIVSFDPADNSFLNADLSCIVSCTNPVENAEVTYEGNTVSNTIDGSNVLFDYTFTNQGEYSFVVQVFDIFDEMDEQTVTYIFDDILPDTLSVTPANNSTITDSNLVITITCTEDIGGASCEFPNSGTGDVSYENEIITIEFTLEEAGDNEFIITFEDLAGNENSITLNYLYETNRNNNKDDRKSR